MRTTLAPSVVGFVFLVCVAMMACGRSTRTTDHARDAGTADPDPSDPCVAHPPITTPALNCAYPLAPTGDAPPLPSVASLTRSGCQYRLGEPISLPWNEEATGGVYSGFVYQFSFDVNGDGVGDLFFWDESYGAIRLALSTVASGVLSYQVVDCDSLTAIPRGRVFVRDVNGDTVPDLVVAPSAYNPPPSDHTSDGPADIAIRAFVNVPTGFVEVLRHEWPEGPGKTTVLDVAVADFDGDGACLRDVAFGYDRVMTGSANAVEFGTGLALMAGRWPDVDVQWRSWVTNASTSEPVRTLGETTAGTGMIRPPMVLASNAADPGKIIPGAVYIRWDSGPEPDEYVLQVETPPTTAPHADQGPFDPWILPIAGVGDSLALLYPESLALYDLGDPTATPLPFLFSVHTLGVHGRDRELGGGPAAATRFMVDVEGDGDLDFIEFMTDDNQVLTAAIHPNLEGAGFGEASAFELIHPNVVAESPFVAVGGAKAALIVNELAPASSGEMIEAPSIQALECAPE